MEDTEKYDWIWDLFSAIPTAECSTAPIWPLIEWGCRSSPRPWLHFGGEDYPLQGQKALVTHLPFAISYLCETFLCSCLNQVKTRVKNGHWKLTKGGSLTANAPLWEDQQHKVSPHQSLKILQDYYYYYYYIYPQKGGSAEEVWGPLIYCVQLIVIYDTIYKNIDACAALVAPADTAIKLE